MGWARTWSAGGESRTTAVEAVVGLSTVQTGPSAETTFPFHLWDLRLQVAYLHTPDVHRIGVGLLGRGCMWEVGQR